MARIIAGATTLIILLCHASADPVYQPEDTAGSMCLLQTGMMQGRVRQGEDKMQTPAADPQHAPLEMLEYAPGRMQQRIQGGATWIQAAQEAGLNLSEISVFGKRIPKFTKSEAMHLLSISNRGGKKHRYNFLGSACNPTGIGTMYNVRGYLPEASRRFRRQWAVDFARSQFADQDYLSLTDVNACADHAQPMGPFDKSFSPERSEDYLDLMAASNFTLCPGGDEPWSMRVYEAAAAGSLPIIMSRTEDLSPKTRGDDHGIAIQAVQDLLYVIQTNQTDSFAYNEDMAEHNRRIFIRYHTFIEGDNTPPGLDFKQNDDIKENVANKEGVCIDHYRRGLNEVRKGLGHHLQASFFKVAKVSDKPLLIGAGVGTTATRSLATALQYLGQNVSHCANGCNVPAVQMFLAPESHRKHQFFQPEQMTESSKEECLRSLGEFDYTSVPEGFDAILDTPVAETFLYLWRSFPNARVVLTERDNVHAWLSSRMKHHRRHAFAPMQNPCGEFLENPAPAMSFTDKQLETLFHMHGDLVRCLVPARQLLEINMFKMDNSRATAFGRLANFVGVKLSDEAMQAGRHGFESTDIH